jgi:CBS domain-containing protein
MQDESVTVSAITDFGRAGLPARPPPAHTRTMDAPAARSAITDNLRAPLLAHAPFAQMDPPHVDALIDAAELAYFAPGEVLTAPDRGIADTCYLIRRGRVRSERLDREGLPVATHELSEGEMFPIGALLAQRAVSSRYRAVGDVFCLCLPAAAFHRLLQQSAAFQDFCARRMQHLLDLSRQDMQAAYVAETASQQAMDQPLRSLLRQPPLVCEVETPLREALTAMHAARVGSIVVTDPHRRPIGIVTRGDVIGKIVLPSLGLDTPVFQIMSHPVQTLSVSARAGDAALLLAQHGIQHLPLVEGERLVGVVSERDLFGLQRVSLKAVSRGIRQAERLPALIQAAADIRALTRGLVAQGVGAARLTGFISALNDQLAERLLQLLAAEHDLADIRWCWIALGSEGRQEQTISTDQDNGLIFESEAADAAPRLLAFAREMNHALRDCGFPLCEGEIMASNPRWCLSLADWQAVFARWIERGDPQSLLNANIFFDFRPLGGDLTARAQAHTRFLKMLADNALRLRPPLNWLGRLAENEDGQLDLKRQGAMPFVDAARVLALKTGVDATDTQSRLQRAGAALRLGEASVQNWLDAFQFVQRQRLRLQHQQAGASRAQANRVDPEQLSEIDRRILREAFRQARKLQQRLAMEFPG